jgi:hypothetical protein
MKPWGAHLGVVLLIALAVLVAPSAAAADDVLGTRAARDLSERIMGTVFRHSDKLDTTSFQGCDRVGRRHVECRYKGIGQTHRTRIGCHYRIEVTIRGRQPVGRVAAHKCLRRSFQVLPRARALRAIWRVAIERSAPDPVALNLQRLGRLRIEGVAVWLHNVTPSSAEVCELNLLAYLLPSGDLELTTSDIHCALEQI